MRLILAFAAAVLVGTSVGAQPAQPHHDRAMVDAANPLHVFAAYSTYASLFGAISGGHYIYQSTDGGATWNKVAPE